ncbi:hypothetical protein NE619_10570 [Anaerovorax odorimutans]|uniref:Uncharacterized protein n=1 Tax=Anaerovorax odorimutans TaxID=109327 RepID=A0ABT1RPP9_9FIRM|nr:hypothetical protein [Anaerovorax odorimutans]MCQ4637169.1 hypothetical protein [Anaerovorax odorimutans]
MKQYLYRVGIEHRKTKERTHLQVWASNVDEATNKLGNLFGCGDEYSWIGSGPVYEDNEAVAREI